MKDLRKLAEKILFKKDLIISENVKSDDECRVEFEDAIDAMLSFHEQASKDMYPKEFVFWFKGQTTFHQCVIEDEIFWYEPNWASNMEPKYYTFDEIYQYFKDNIYANGTKIKRLVI